MNIKDAGITMHVTVKQKLADPLEGFLGSRNIPFSRVLNHGTKRLLAVCSHREERLIGDGVPGGMAWRHCHWAYFSGDWIFFAKEEGARYFQVDFLNLVVCIVPLEADRGLEAARVHWDKSPECADRVRAGRGDGVQVDTSGEITLGSLIAWLAVRKILNILCERFSEGFIAGFVVGLDQGPGCRLRRIPSPSDQELELWLLYVIYICRIICQNAGCIAIGSGQCSECGPLMNGAAGPDSKGVGPWAEVGEFAVDALERIFSGGRWRTRPGRHGSNVRY